MRIISSIGDPFEGQFARRLRESARKMGIDCELFDGGRSSAARDRARLNAIQRGLSELGDDALVYVDPDAHLMRRPGILLDEKDFDVGVYYDARTLVMSGPIFIRNNRRTASLLREWSVVNKALPEFTDRENLGRLLSRPALRVVVRRLPVTYAWVERHHRRAHPNATPVIVHFQTDGLLTGRMKIPESRR